MGDQRGRRPRVLDRRARERRRSDDLEAGEQIEFTVELDNPLSAGRYYVGCSVTRGSAGLDILLYQERAADIVSYGADLDGLVGIDHVSSVTRTRSGEVVLMTTETLQLSEVRGPSALGGDWRRFWHLTWVISRTDYKLTYFGSVLGYLWSFMQPLLFFGVLYVVFAVVMNFNKGVQDFPVLLLMNIVLFGFFQQRRPDSITSVVVRENLVRKMHFPRLVIPLATVTTTAINLVFNLVVVMLFMLVYGVSPRSPGLLPLVVLALFVLATGLAMLLSALYVRYRDVAPIWGVISQALYFASPVFILINSILPHGRR